MHMSAYVSLCIRCSPCAVRLYALYKRPDDTAPPCESTYLNDPQQSYKMLVCVRVCTQVDVYEARHVLAPFHSEAGVHLWPGAPSWSSFWIAYTTRLINVEQHGQANSVEPCLVMFSVPVEGWRRDSHDSLGSQDPSGATSGTSGDAARISTCVCMHA